MAVTMLAPVRPSWYAVPDVLRDAITARAGVVEDAVSQAGGFTPGLASRLVLRGGGRIFVKGLPSDHALAASYRYEAACAALLPAAVPAPRLRWHEEVAGWIVLGFDDVEGHHPLLGPPGRDLARVLDAVTSLQVPVSGLPQRADRIGPWLHGWAELAAAPPGVLHPWAAAHLPALAAAERGWLPAAGGGTLVHGDLRADNMLAADSGVVLVDWAFASAGATWLDLADLVPQMILAGHTPASAEEHLGNLAAWRAAPDEAVTSYAAACAGYWTRSAMLPVPADAPHLRRYQARAGRAAVEWVAWRWGRRPA